MTSAWQRVFQEIRDDHRSGASTLLADALEAGRLFLGATRRVPPRRLTADLARFTRRLTASQPSMAPFLTLANALWLCVDEAPAGLTWSRLHEALARYADAVDRGLLATIRIDYPGSGKGTHARADADFARLERGHKSHVDHRGTVRGERHPGG